MRAKVLVWMTALMAAAGPALAQYEPPQFGKNRVQYSQFYWKEYNTPDFDLYHYQGGEEIAQLALDYLKTEYDQLTNQVGYIPYTKVKIFLYNSTRDLQQSNVGLNLNNYTQEGQTVFVTGTVEIAYPGSVDAFKAELRYKLAELLIHDMMFGGSVTEAFQSTFLMNLPQWFIPGAARYIAFGWSEDMDDWARDFLANQPRRLKLNKFDQAESALLGQSIFNFIGYVYGEDKVSSVLNLTRIIRNEESAISGTLGIRWKTFLERWRNYYWDGGYAEVNAEYDNPEQANRLRRKNRRGWVYNDIALSPGGRHVAYTEMYRGKFRIRLYDTQTTKNKIVHVGGFKRINQEVEENIPVVAWQDSTHLGWIYYHQGRTFLRIEDITTGRFLKREINRFSHINDFAFSPQGNLAAMSVAEDGQSDLYLYSLNRNAVRRLTRDLYDDREVAFFPDGKQLIFSSNRTDKAPVNRNVELEKLGKVYNLFLYNIDTTRAEMVQLTNTASNERQPLPIDEGRVLFLTDQKGISNVHLYDVSQRSYRQVSNFNAQLKAYDYSAGELAFISYDDGAEYPYLDPTFSLDKALFTSQTKRQVLLQAQQLRERQEKQRLADDRREAREAEDQPVAPRPLSPVDSVAQDIMDRGLVNTYQYSFGRLAPGTRDAAAAPAQQQVGPSVVDPVGADIRESGGVDTYAYAFGPVGQPAPQGLLRARPDSTIINTDNFEFELEPEDQGDDNRLARLVRPVQSPESFLAKLRNRTLEEEKVVGPLPYQRRFYWGELSTQPFVDPFMNFGLDLRVGMADLLENHRIDGRVVGSFSDFRSSIVEGEYSFLRYWTDFKAGYKRRSLFWTDFDGRAPQTYTEDKAWLGVDLPVNSYFRLGIRPFYNNVTFTNMDLNATITPGLAPAQEREDYWGTRLEAVVDNTTLHGFNQYNGVKAVASVDIYRNTQDPQLHFSKLHLESRYYLRLHQELTLATRLFYGRFYGDTPPIFLLGGIPNLISLQPFHFANERTPQENPLYTDIQTFNRRLLFTETAPLVRGFRYGILDGTNSMVFNAELRWPIISYFSNGPIASNFLRNLQLNAFYDVGSAWTGRSPFRRENSVNTRNIRANSFEAEVQTFTNPWKMSVGAGLRTVALGYFVKVDVAWPVEEFRVRPEWPVFFGITQTPRVIVSLGHDF